MKEFKRMYDIITKSTNIDILRTIDLKMVKDKLMSSSSYAASLVAGNSRSGPQSWKTEKGELLKAVEERLVNKT